MFEATQKKKHKKKRGLDTKKSFKDVGLHIRSKLPSERPFHKQLLILNPSMVEKEHFQ